MAITNLIDENKLKATNPTPSDGCPHQGPPPSPSLSPVIQLAMRYQAKLTAWSLFDSVVVDLPACQALKAQGVDLDSVTRLSGPIVRVHAGFGPECLAWGDDYGEVAFAMAVHGEDTTDVIDLVAWSAREPEVFGVMFGAGVLGLDQLLNPASYATGPCMIHETPLDWLRADCSGAVVLQYDAARKAFHKAPGVLTAASLPLAAELVNQGLVPAERLVVPSSWRDAA